MEAAWKVFFFCDDGNEPSGSRKGKEFYDQLTDY
jgi:hypothetical protein